MGCALSLGGSLVLVGTVIEEESYESDDKEHQSAYYYPGPNGNSDSGGRFADFKLYEKYRGEGGYVN